MKTGVIQSQAGYAWPDNGVVVGHEFIATGESAHVYFPLIPAYERLFGAKIFANEAGDGPAMEERVATSISHLLPDCPGNPREFFLGRQKRRRAFGMARSVTGVDGADRMRPRGVRLRHARGCFAGKASTQQGRNAGIFHLLPREFFSDRSAHPEGGDGSLTSFGLGRSGIEECRGQHGHFHDGRDRWARRGATARPAVLLPYPRTGETERRKIGSSWRIPNRPL